MHTFTTGEGPTPESSAADRVFGNEIDADALEFERRRQRMIDKLEAITGPLEIFGTAALARPDDSLPIPDGGEQVTRTRRFLS